MLKPKQARLYRRGYALLFAQITHLVSLAEAPDSTIGALILYGSTARLEPHRNSDADLLVLLRELSQAERAYSSIVEAMSIYDEWPFAPLNSNLEASNLPEELVEQIARDGVLLYLRPGLRLPKTLEQITPYEAWRARVQHLLKPPISA